MHPPMRNLQEAFRLNAAAMDEGGRSDAGSQEKNMVDIKKNYKPDFHKNSAVP